MTSDETRGRMITTQRIDNANFILRSRNAYAAWRYDSPGLGDNDSSVTGWMVLALVAARDAGLVIEESALLDLEESCRAEGPSPRAVPARAITGRPCRWKAAAYCICATWTG